MASEGPNNPGTMADDATIGTDAWNNVNNAKASDDSYADVGAVFGADGIPYETSIKVVKADDTYSSTDKSTGANLPFLDTYITYGDATELWGESWTAANINHANFGVGFACESTAGMTQWYSHYLKATNFGFSIPGGATINGIKVEIEQKQYIILGRTIVNVDHIKITVYYTEAIISPFPTHFRM